MTAVNFRGGFGNDGLAPMDWHVWKNDFDFYLATDWVITETGSGTRAISQAKNGILLITNAAADDDANFLQLRDVASGQVAEHWKHEAAKRMFFESRFKVSDATQSDFVMGLQITDTTPLAVSDGIYFRKDDGDDNLDFVVIKDSTATTTTSTDAVADDTYLTLTWMYNGDGNFVFYKDGVLLGGCGTTNAPDDEELCVSFGIQNGAAAAKSMSLDYIMVAQER